MKKFVVTSRVSSSAKAAISNAIEQHDRYKKSYFWSPGGNASSRRRNESSFSRNHPAFSLIDGETTIEVLPYYSESCKNCFYSMTVRVNGQAKDVRAIKKYIK
jgi:hypothetical protein